MLIVLSWVASVIGPNFGSQLSTISLYFFLRTAFCCYSMKNCKIYLYILNVFKIHLV